MSFCLIDKVHEAWGRGYGRTMDVKSMESPGGGGQEKGVGSAGAGRRRSAPGTLCTGRASGPPGGRCVGTDPGWGRRGLPVPGEVTQLRFRDRLRPSFPGLSSMGVERTVILRKGNSASVFSFTPLSH